MILFLSHLPYLSFYHLSAPSFLSCNCRDCAVDVSFGTGYPTISCSLHFDQLRLPILVSVWEKKFLWWGIQEMEPKALSTLNTMLYHRATYPAWKRSSWFTLPLGIVIILLGFSKLYFCQMKWLNHNNILAHSLLVHNLWDAHMTLDACSGSGGAILKITYWLNKNFVRKGSKGKHQVWVIGVK